LCRLGRKELTCNLTPYGVLSTQQAIEGVTRKRIRHGKGGSFFLVSAHARMMTGTVVNSTAGAASD
jgi:hypothetical protein